MAPSGYDKMLTGR